MICVSVAALLMAMWALVALIAVVAKVARLPQRWASLTLIPKKPPSFREISEALDRDIAKAEARGIHVDKTERMAPSRPRIKF